LVDFSVSVSGQLWFPAIGVRSSLSSGRAQVVHPWESCRGIGFSFGYNQVEDQTQSLDGTGLAKHLTDVVSRGGRLLLNVGPTADGAVSTEFARPSDEPYVRWLSAPVYLVAVVDAGGTVPLEASDKVSS